MRFPVPLARARLRPGSDALSAGVDMRWKWLALAGCLTPALGGCNLMYYAAHNIANEALVVCEERSISHEVRKEGKAAWQEVRCQFPRRMFTAEFHDGFVDGYADYLDRGGSAAMPAVPPLKYTRHKKYFTPEGHALIRDYFLGFKYGMDVAVATGHRQFLTVPVLLPEKDQGPPVFNVQASGVPVPDPIRPDPTKSGLPAVPPPGRDTKFGPLPHATDPTPVLPPMPMPMLPLPPDNGPSKFDPPPDPDAGIRMPAPNPPLPIPAMPQPDDAGPTPASAEVQPVPGAELPGFKISLPEPPAEVPNLPAELPTPSLIDDLPVLPPNHTIPPPLPANHATPPPPSRR